MAKSDEPVSQEQWYFRNYAYASEYQRMLPDIDFKAKVLLENYTQMSLKYGGVKSSMTREAIMKALNMSPKQFKTAKKALVDSGYISSDQQGHHGLASVTLLEKAFHTKFRGRAHSKALKNSHSFRDHEAEPVATDSIDSIDFTALQTQADSQAKTLQEAREASRGTNPFGSSDLTGT